MVSCTFFKFQNIPWRLLCPSPIRLRTYNCGRWRNVPLETSRDAFVFGPRCRQAKPVHPGTAGRVRGAYSAPVPTRIPRALIVVRWPHCGPADGRDDGHTATRTVLVGRDNVAGNRRTRITGRACLIYAALIIVHTPSQSCTTTGLACRIRMWQPETTAVPVADCRFANGRDVPAIAIGADWRAKGSLRVSRRNACVCMFLCRIRVRTHRMSRVVRMFSSAYVSCSALGRRVSTYDVRRRTHSHPGIRSRAIPRASVTHSCLVFFFY